ncbi:MAG: mucoidy inhibitor MuiA family protein [Opitutales bacterium]|nr:mucoidy inhibitor MuiA family protein [Opitutales bacterium]
MKTPVAITLCMSFAYPLFAGSVNVDSTISSVTVYQGMAKVTRSFEIELNAAEKTSLRFDGLPRYLVADSVQLSVSGGTPLSIGTVSFDNELTPADKSDSVKALEERMRGLESKRDALVQKKKMLNVRASSMQALATSVNRGIAESGLDLYSKALEAMEEAEKAQQEAFEQSTVIDEQIRVLDVEKDALAMELKLAREKDDATCAEYLVEAVSAGGKSSGTISYYIDGPRWEPFYIVKADTQQGTLNVEYKASVYQQSGEDWDNALVTLETARPSRSAEPTKPRPVFLHKVEPMARDNMIMKSVRMESAMMAAPMEARAAFADASNAVTVTSSMTGFSATLKDRTSIPSADKATSITIMLRDMDCAFHSETIPMTAESAFLLGKVKNAFPLPLLRGQMQAIVDGSTNGTGRIEETLPNEEITIGLGVNQNIIVKRKTIAEKGKDSGIFGSKRVEERHYVNTISNRMSVPQRIVVKDRLPISKDEKIEVKLLEPAKLTPDSETGLFEQEITLKPGESVDLPTKFRVSYPADWTINGNY